MGKTTGWSNRILSMALALVTVVSITSIAGAATLRVFTYPREWEVERVNAAMQHFHQRHPNVEVSVHAGWMGVMDTMIAGGLAPDTMLIDYGSIPQLIGKNILMPVDTFLQRDNEITIKHYLPTVLGFVSWAGRPVGLPINMSAMGLLYNMNLFDKAGVAYPDESWTWNHYIQAGKKLTIDITGTGEYDQFGIDLRWGDHSFWPAFVYQSGGSFWNADYTQSVVASPEVQRALEFLMNLVAEHRVNPRHRNSTVLEERFSGLQVGQLFGERRAAMTWGGNILIRDPDFQQRLSVGMTRMPHGPVSRASLINGDFVAMYRHTGHQDLAWEFMKSISITSRERHLTAAEPLLPVDSDTLRSKLTLPQYRHLPRDVMFSVHVDGRMAEVHHPATPAIYRFGWDVIDSQFFTGEKKPIRPMLEDLQRTINAEISNALRQGARWTW